MLVSDIENPFTVEMLSEIVASQLCCFGDHLLIVEPVPGEFEAGIEITAEDNVILVCERPQVMEQKKVTLSSLLLFLDQCSPKSLIDTQYSVSDSFKVGFYEKDEGFIEVFHINDLVGSE
ncbi:hypothetical protein PULV_a4066 [Pseudoalteromonas ulvae UL12]|uniref:hypothetical protein n=1 Tax=Pseudoalteromonas ulvae TaxID=107327 RepID=UPI00186B6311|nr:hypothetical protein [Pseudoalteromonas ulvae]MBE0362249.1 hypothetical protein [Pseudoalteromonas ulvae UL12]